MEEDLTDPVSLQLHWQTQFQFPGYYGPFGMVFEEEGLGVTILPGIDQEGHARLCTEEVAAGRATFGVGASGILLAQSRGADFQIVGSFF